MTLKEERGQIIDFFSGSMVVDFGDRRPAARLKKEKKISSISSRILVEIEKQIKEFHEEYGNSFF